MIGKENARTCAVAETSAPASTSARTHSALPASAARRSGVYPS